MKDANLVLFWLHQMLNPAHKTSLFENWRWVRSKSFESGHSAPPVYFACGPSYCTKQDHINNENINTSAAKKKKKQCIHYCNFESHMYVYLCMYIADDCYVFCLSFLFSLFILACLSQWQNGKKKKEKINKHIWHFPFFFSMKIKSY